MNRETRRLVEGLEPRDLKTLEISGTDWGTLGLFTDYSSVHYPEYDVCEAPLDEQFDLIIAEQVFEHLLWPYRAGRNVLAMLKPGGWFLVTTPFLIRIHEGPHDCSRWTETGLRHFLLESGFGGGIQTGSWGNRACVRANLTRKYWPMYARRIHSLRNEVDTPVTVWALAQKSG